MEPLPEKQREKEIYKVTIVGGVANLVLVAAKFIAGIMGRSAAMTADAVHSLSDFLTDIIVIIFVRISGKPKDDNHRYGHGKFETLATLIIALILLCVGGLLLYNSTIKIIGAINGEHIQSPGMIAFWAAVVSIIVKEVLYRYTVIRGRRLKSDAVVANGWHHRSDAFSSVGTAIGIGGAVFLGEKWTVLDPVAALIVSVFIIRTALRLMKSPIDELMEKSLPESDEHEISRIVDSFEGVSDLHNLHTRKIGNKYAIEFHIRMDGQLTLEQTHNTITNIEKRLRETYGQQTHVMIHMEPLKEK